MQRVKKEQFKKSFLRKMSEVYILLMLPFQIKLMCCSCFKYAVSLLNHFVRKRIQIQNKTTYNNLRFLHSLSTGNFDNLLECISLKNKYLHNKFTSKYVTSLVQY